MASFSGFLRKSPSARLKTLLEKRGVVFPDDFNWKSDGRLTKFAAEITKQIDDLPPLPQDAMKAELDHLASLSNDKGMQAAEQVCPGRQIDLEGLEGVQDVILMLAVHHPRALERIGVQASLNQRYGGRSWSSFQFEDSGTPWTLDDSDARDAFVTEAIEILELPAHRRWDADWYTTTRLHPIAGEESELTHATLFVEDHAASELGFGKSEGLKRQVIQRVVEVGIACDPKERIVEISANGGKAVRDKYANVFSKHFAPGAPPPVDAPRRQVLLGKLRDAPAFVIEPADGIDRVEVSSLDCYAKGGGFARFERRGKDETIHQFITRNFGEASPLNNRNWMITAATLRVFLKATDEKSARTLTVTLRTPNTTTIPNKTDEDRQFVLRLLERWSLIAPPPEDVEVVAAE